MSEKIAGAPEMIEAYDGKSYFFRLLWFGDAWDVIQYFPRTRTWKVTEHLDSSDDSSTESMTVSHYFAPGCSVL